MDQHINLLTQRKVHQGFLNLAFIGLGLLVLVLAALAGMTQWRLQTQQNLQAQTRQTVLDLRAAIDQKRQALGLAESEAMQRQIVQLHSQVDAKREWADLVQKGELGNANGYSQWLETLAGVHVDGVWLQGLDIGKGGQSVNIQGKSLSADAVMRYIESVNEAFKPMNVRFTSMEISQDAANAEPGAPRQAQTLTFKIY